MSDEPRAVHDDGVMAGAASAASGAQAAATSAQASASDAQAAATSAQVTATDILRELRDANDLARSAKSRLEAVEAKARRLTVGTWLSIVALIALAAIGAVRLSHVSDNALRRDAFIDGCELVNAKAIKPLHDLLVTIQSGSTRTPALPGLGPDQLRALEAARAEANRTIYEPGIASTTPVDCGRLARAG